MDIEQIHPDVLRWVDAGLHGMFAEEVSAGAFDRALGLTKSETRISLCLDMMLARIIDPEDEGTPDVVASAISAGDHPCREYDMLYALLSRFHRQGRRGFDGERARKAFGELPEQITIYRGTVEAEDKNGFCWSLDRDQAVFFATKHFRFRVTDSVPVILTATVNRDDIFALMFERDEQEVMISPAILGEVEVTEA